MEGPKDGESKKESSPQKIDPACVRDALKTFFKPIKSDNPLLDFYAAYNEEASEFDVEYIKKYDEDLNTTLIFAGLFSAISAAFIIDIYKQLQPDLSNQSVDLLRAILLTLNHSAIPNEILAVPAIQENPPSEIVAVNCLLFASLLMSLLAAFVAMLGKQWLNRYLGRKGGSMIDRCGERQRKFDGLQRWRFYFIIESLPVMLQVALLLLACGLCRYLFTINTPVACTLIILTGLGVLFYLVVVIAGASSRDCPFQTPVSVRLRRLWKEVGPIILPVIKTLRALGGTVWRHIPVVRSVLLKSHHHFLTLLERIRLGILYIGSYLPPIGPNVPRHFQNPPLPMTWDGSRSPDPQEITPWLTLDKLDTVQKKNSNHIRCVSWVLKDITNPETLDAAIILAGTIRWFEDGIDVKPLYDRIIFTFNGCFGFDQALHLGSRNRAYHSARAILWIHTLAVCKSEEVAREFSIPTGCYSCPPSDPDLQQLLCPFTSHNALIGSLLNFSQGNTLLHLQWTSSVLLHLSWATQTRPNFPSGPTNRFIKELDAANAPLDTLFNILLMCCNLLGSPVGEEVFKIRDKSDHMGQVIGHVSGAIDSASKTSNPEVIWGALYILTQVKERPKNMEEAAYKWCAVIWRNRHSYYGYWEALLLLSLEAGFRHIHPSGSDSKWPPEVTVAELHQEVFDTVLKSNNSEAITDLARASFLIDRSGQLGLNIFVNYIVNLRGGATEPFPQGLRQTFIFCVERIGLGALRNVGEEPRLVESLNSLHIGIEDLDHDNGREAWSRMLLETIQSTEGAQRLDIHSWELLEKLATLGYPKSATYDPDVTTSLVGGEEWAKLERWIFIVLKRWPPEPGNIPRELEGAMEVLEKKRPGAIQKRMMEQQPSGDLPATVQQTHDKLTLLTEPPNEGPFYLPSPGTEPPSSAELGAIDSNEGEPET